MKVILDIDPARLSTAQQKIIAFKAKRVITNPRVARGMRMVKTAMMVKARLVRRTLDEFMTVNPQAGISLRVAFKFEFPATGTKREKASRFEDQPVTSGRWGDLDNRQKSFQDALMKSGAIPDDHFISELLLRKRYTFGKPRIEIGFFLDGGGEPIFTPEGG